MRERAQALGSGKLPAKHIAAGRLALGLLAGLIILAATGSAWADDDGGWKHWRKHHDTGWGYYDYPAYVYAPPPPAYVVVPPPRVVYVRPEPVYVQPYPVYPQPLINVVIPLKID